MESRDPISASGYRHCPPAAASSLAQVVPFLQTLLFPSALPPSTRGEDSQASVPCDLHSPSQIVSLIAPENRNSASPWPTIQVSFPFASLALHETPSSPSASPVQRKGCGVVNRPGKRDIEE